MYKNWSLTRTGVTKILTEMLIAATLKRISALLDMRLSSTVTKDPMKWLGEPKTGEKQSKPFNFTPHFYSGGIGNSVRMRVWTYACMLCCVVLCSVLFCYVMLCYVTLCYGWDRWMDGWMNGWVDGWKGGWVDIYLPTLPSTNRSMCLF